MNKALILAGGIGSRFLTKKPKQFLPFNGEMLITYSITAALSAQCIDSVVIVCHKDYINFLETFLSSFEVSKKKKIEVIEGGNNRIDSTLLGLKHCVGNGVGSVILLDANRPFVTSQHIDALYAHFKEDYSDYACFFSKIKESLFFFDEGGQPSGVDRSKYVTTQTPCIFTYESVLDIVSNSEEKTILEDMDIMSFISKNKKLTTRESNFLNIKITLPEDLILGEALMKIHER